MTYRGRKLLPQRTFWTQVLCAPTGIAPPHHALLINSLKLSFVLIFSVAEIHGLWFTVGRITSRACSVKIWVIPIPTQSCRPKIVLGIKSDAHGLLEGSGVNPENLGPGNAITQSLHEYGHIDRPG